MPTSLMIIQFPKLEEWQKTVFDDVKDSYGKGKIFTVKARRQL